tara:strand:+ start:296 stop:1393 length:1098 start_codon:yes stop_codon:yes gene_type:complete
VDNIAEVVVEELNSSGSFNVNKVFKKIIESLTDDDSLSIIKQKLENKLGPKCTKNIVCGMIRSSFLIQLVKQPDAGSSPMAERWTVRFVLGKSDPRFSKPQTCTLVFEKLLNQLDESLHIEEFEEYLKLFCSSNNSQVSFELPIDYLDPTLEKLHVPENIYWFGGQDFTRLLKLRAALKQLESVNQRFIIECLKKMQLKTYKTDRVKTADVGAQHYTNREYRWETHPNSVHFALRRQCMLIELELIEQLTRFDGFPQEARDSLLKEGLIIENNEGVHRCPITLETIVFEEFRDSVLNPIHGRSPYQVGHLSPLKFGDDDEPGHVSGNIAWITEDGNRIQGGLSMDETRELLLKIFSNYSSEGLFN